MNSKYTETSDPHRLLLSFTNKIDLRRKDKYIALPNLSNYYTLLCLIVGGAQIANFREKNLQVHLVIIRE